MRTAIYPGTFDPVTLGHLDVINKAIKVVDKLIIGVASDTHKPVCFPADIRARLIKKSLQAVGFLFPNIEIIIFEGLLVKFVEEQNSNLIIRGLRAVSDFEYEFQMSWINHKLSPNIQTIFLPASEENQFVSSSFIKQVARLNGDLTHFVPLEIIDDIKSFTR